MLRALGFAFSSAEHSHRHTADKWARPAVTPYHFCPVGRIRPGPPTCRLSADRREKVNASCFGFRFLKHRSFAPPYGGQVGAPGGHALPFLPDPMGRQRFLKDLTTGLLYHTIKLIQSYDS
jgi:hypothetical protein